MNIKPGDEVSFKYGDNLEYFNSGYVKWINEDGTIQISQNKDNFNCQNWVIKESQIISTSDMNKKL
jgi:hypothetical protein